MGRVYRAYYTKKDTFEQDDDNQFVLNESGQPKLKRFFTKGFSIEYTNAKGKTVRRKAGLSREAAKDALRKAESDVLAERNGLPTRRTSEILLEKLVEEYLAAHSRAVTKFHLKTLKSRLYKVLDGTKAVFVRDLTTQVVRSYLDRIYEDKERNLSIAGRNGRRTGKMPFCHCPPRLLARCRIGKPSLGKVSVQQLLWKFHLQF